MCIYENDSYDSHDDGDSYDSHDNDDSYDSHDDDDSYVTVDVIYAKEMSSTLTSMLMKCLQPSHLC